MPEHIYTGTLFMPEHLYAGALIFYIDPFTFRPFIC